MEKINNDHKKIVEAYEKICDHGKYYTMIREYGNKKICTYAVCCNKNCFLKNNIITRNYWCHRCQFSCKKPKEWSSHLISNKHTERFSIYLFD